MSRGWSCRGLVLIWVGLWLLAACGPAPSATPVAVVPAATTEPAGSAPATHTATARPQATDIPATPTGAAAPAIPTADPLDADGLLAWTVAGDGAVFVLDASHVLYHLAPDTLAPIAQSAQLIPSGEDAAAYLVADEQDLFVGSTVISQTLVLERDGFHRMATLEAVGPLALDPGRRLLMLPLGLEAAWPFGSFEVWAYDLADLSRPPERLLRDTGAALDDLVIDAASRRLYLLTSNIAASPPHQGQTYAIYDLDSLAPPPPYGGNGAA